MTELFHWKGIEAIPVLDEARITFERGLVRVPYRLADGTVHNAKLFAPDGRCWWETCGRELIPFGLDQLPDDDCAAEAVLLIAEGESDSLALRCAFGGVTEASPFRGYYVLGIPGARSWRTEWSEYAWPFARTYVIGDGDAAGRALNFVVVEDVPWARPVRLPDGEDARSLLMRDGWRAIDLFLDEADKMTRLRDAFFVADCYDEFVELLGRDGAFI